MEVLRLAGLKGAPSYPLENNDIKPKILLFAAWAAAMLGISDCFGQNNMVFYGANTNALNVAFADTNLSASAQSGVVADLRICLQEWGRTSELDLGPYEPGLAGYLYNFKKAPHYPDELKFPRNLITNQVSGLALQIPKPLSDAYTNAFVFAAANSNAVAAAYEFVAFVSSTNFPDISPAALPNYIMFKNALPDANAESNAIVNLAPQIIPDLCEQAYHLPSVLGFRFSSDGPAATNLWMWVPNSCPTGGGALDWGSTSVLWHDGKWRFCTWMDWVP